MTRPLIADRKRDSEAARWHREVFEAHGRVCHFCPKNATDAMHVIPRASLGKLRYTMPKENGRPGCRDFKFPADGITDTGRIHSASAWNKIGADFIERIEAAIQEPGSGSKE